MVPLLCRCNVGLRGGGVTTNFGGVDVVPLITQKLVFAIWGLCWYNCLLCLKPKSDWSCQVGRCLLVSIDDLGSFAKEFGKRMPVETDFGQGILVALKTSTNC